MPRQTRADLEARIAELEALVGDAVDCPVCAAVDDGVERGVRAELALMPDALRKAPGLAASTVKLAQRLDQDLDDIAPAPMHSALVKHLDELRAKHVPVAEVADPVDEIGARRVARRATAASS